MLELDPYGKLLVATVNPVVLYCPLPYQIYSFILVLGESSMDGSDAVVIPCENDGISGDVHSVFAVLILVY